MFVVLRGSGSHLRNVVLSSRLAYCFTALALSLSLSLSLCRVKSQVMGEPDLVCDGYYAEVFLRHEWRKRDRGWGKMHESKAYITSSLHEEKNKLLLTLFSCSFFCPC